MLKNQDLFLSAVICQWPETLPLIFFYDYCDNFCHPLIPVFYFWSWYIYQVFFFYITATQIYLVEWYKCELRQVQTQHRYDLSKNSTTVLSGK